MILPSKKDAIHRSWLFRLLIEIVDDDLLSQSLIFKGGTCATMLGYLDRFSVDLDFDRINDDSDNEIRLALSKIFSKLRLEVKDESKTTLQYFLKYNVPKGMRNTLKLDIVDISLSASIFQNQFLSDIQRYATCQTIETMFAHKLVAITNRYRRNKTIAGRDIYDIHHFFVNGYEYDGDIIKQRTGKDTVDYLVDLRDFIDKKVTETIINQDLNTVLSHEQFSKVRKVLKSEVLLFVDEDINQVVSKNS